MVSHDLALFTVLLPYFWNCDSGGFDCWEFQRRIFGSMGKV